MSKKLIVFDLDQTFIRINSSFAFCNFLLKKQFLSLYDFLHVLGIQASYRFAGGTIEEVHHKSFNRLLKGKNQSHINTLAKEFVNAILHQYICPLIAERASEARKRNDVTLLLSSSPEFLVQPMAAANGFDYYSSTEYAIDNKNQFCKISRLVEGVEKAKFVKELSAKLGISLTNVTAYTDSIHDLPLLIAVGEPVAVFPDKKLKKLATENGWEIIETIRKRL